MPNPIYSNLDWEGLIGHDCSLSQIACSFTLKGRMLRLARYVHAVSLRFGLPGGRQTSKRMQPLFHFKVTSEARCDTIIFLLELEKSNRLACSRLVLLGAWIHLTCKSTHCLMEGLNSDTLAFSTGRSIWQKLVSDCVTCSASTLRRFKLGEVGWSNGEALVIILIPVTPSFCKCRETSCKLNRLRFACFFSILMTFWGVEWPSNEPRLVLRSWELCARRLTNSFSFANLTYNQAAAKKNNSGTI